MFTHSKPTKILILSVSLRLYQLRMRIQIKSDFMSCSTLLCLKWKVVIINVLLLNRWWIRKFSKYRVHIQGILINTSRKPIGNKSSNPIPTFCK